MEKVLEIVLYILSIGMITFSLSYTIYLISKLTCKENYPFKKIVFGFAYFLPITIITTWIYNNMPNLNFVKSIITIISCLMITYFLYKVTITKTVIITTLATIIQFIFDMLVVLVISIFFKSINSMEEILKNRTVYYLISIIINTVSVSVLKLIDIILSKKSIISSDDNRNVNYKVIIYQGTVIIITLIPSMFLMFSNNYDYSAIFVIINTMQLIIVSIFSFLYMKKRMLFKDTELELENTKLHNKALSTINEGIRGFKHDMGNMVQAINGYIAVGNIDGVKQYCQNLLQGFNDVNLLSILSPKVINNPAIYGIVVGKMLYARDNDLNLSLDVALDVTNVNFPSFELSRIIGILLDNAIEAALDSAEKKLKLEMYHDENKKSDVIIIGNSVKNPNEIDIIKMFEKDYSTKENPSGFGLYEVLKFLHKNNKGDIVPNIDYDNNFFTQTLIFDK